MKSPAFKTQCIGVMLDAWCWVTSVSENGTKDRNNHMNSEKMLLFAQILRSSLDRTAQKDNDPNWTESRFIVLTWVSSSPGLKPNGAEDPKTSSGKALEKSS